MSTKVAPQQEQLTVKIDGPELKRHRKSLDHAKDKTVLDPALQNTDKTKNFPWIKRRDKAMFIISACNVMLIAFLTGGYQWLMPYYYTLAILPCLVLRYWSYGRGQGRYSYFLLDLCYWGNFSLLLYLWIPTYEYTEYFFACVYAIATGPMAWAVIVFRNSMAFHSLDKSVSNFIHICPMLVVFVIRWHTPVVENMFNTSDIAGHPREVFPHNWTGLGRFKICESHRPCFTNWWLWMFLVPVGVQIVWALMYAFATRVCCRLKDHHVDSFRYLTAKGAILQKLGKWKNQKLAYFVYVLINITVNMVMTFPAALFYWNFYVNLALIALIIVASLVNGANFYIEVFSKRYLKQVEKVGMQELEERRQNLKKSQSRQSDEPSQSPNVEILPARISRACECKQAPLEFEQEE